MNWKICNVCSYEAKSAIGVFYIYQLNNGGRTQKAEPVRSAYPYPRSLRENLQSEINILK